MKKVIVKLLLSYTLAAVGGDGYTTTWIRENHVAERRVCDFEKSQPVLYGRYPTTERIVGVQLAKAGIAVGGYLLLRKKKYLWVLPPLWVATDSTFGMSHNLEICPQGLR